MPRCVPPSTPQSQVYTRPIKTEISFSDFLKDEGGPYYLLFMDFFAISFEDGRHDAHCD